MDQDIIQHGQTLTSWRTVQLDRDSNRTVSVVETDLALGQDDSDYDEVAFSGLVEAIRGHLEKHQNIESADVHRIR